MRVTIKSWKRIIKFAGIILFCIAFDAFEETHPLIKCRIMGPGPGGHR